MDNRFKFEEEFDEEAIVVFSDITETCSFN